MSDGSETFDAVVVGGGPTGLTHGPLKIEAPGKCRPADERTSQCQDTPEYVLRWALLFAVVWQRRISTSVSPFSAVFRLNRLFPAFVRIELRPNQGILHRDRRFRFTPQLHAQDAEVDRVADIGVLVADRDVGRLLGFALDLQIIALLLVSGLSS